MQPSKNLLLVFLIFVCTNQLRAQQRDFNWRIGATYGYSNYYGDLTPYRFEKISDWDAIRHVLDYNPNKNVGASYQINLERRLSNTIGFYLRYSFYDFSMNDRFTDKNGKLWLDAPNFDRGLNFRNQSRDYGIGFSLKTDNDRLLSSTAFIAPYLNLGFGMLDFKVFGDLFDNTGNLYDFTEPNLIQNRTFETALHSLQAEQAFDQRTFYTNFGLGVRFRLSSKVELFLQSDILRAFTNHLDDVAGKYRETFDNELQAHASNPTGLPINPLTDYRGNMENKVDWIINHGAGLRFNFGFNKKSFVASSVIPLRPYTPLVTTVEYDTPTGVTIDFDKSNYITKELYEDAKEEITIQNAQQQLLDRQILAEQSRIRKIDSAQVTTKLLIRDFQSQNEQLRSRLLANELSTEEFDSETNTTTQKMLRSLDSMQISKNRSYFKIDSLMAEKSSVYQNKVSERFSYENSYQEGLINTSKTTKNKEIANQPTDFFTKTKQESSRSPDRSISQEEKIQLKTESTSNSKIQRTSENQTSSNFSTRNDLSDRNASLDDFYLSEIQRLRQENTKLRQQPNSITNTRSSTQTQRVIVDDRGNARKNARALQKEERKAIRREERRINGTTFLGGLFAGAAVSSAISTSDRSDEEGIETLTPNKEAIVNDNLEVSPMKNQVNDPIPSRLAWSAPTLPTIDWDSLALKPKTSIPEADEVALNTIDSKVSAAEEFRLIPSKKLIFFDINQSTASEVELKKLMPLVEFIKQNPNYLLNISGYADNTGSLTYNLRLADERMRSVGKALIDSFGVDEAQIEFSEGGKIVRGNSQRSESNDRRVEVIIIEKPTKD